jgi:hypothetical protein
MAYASPRRLVARRSPSHSVSFLAVFPEYRTSAWGADNATPANAELPRSTATWSEEPTDAPNSTTVLAILDIIWASRSSEGGKLDR